MGSIGNDIVALNATDPARTITPRFYQKFLSPAELDLYHRQAAPLSLHYFAWMAWSAKEAAYKCLQRLQPDLVFSPVGIEIQSIRSPSLQVIPPYLCLESSGFIDAECFICEVRFSNQTLHARAIIYGDELIHTVACFDTDFSAVSWGIKQINSADPAQQSFAVRSFLSDRLKMSFPLSDIRVDKDGAGIPFISVGDKIIPVSLSHHDKWVGYAF